MNLHDLSPMRALREAWDDIESEFRDTPDDVLPTEVVRAKESVDALMQMRASMKTVGAERRRLKSRAQ